MWYNSLWLWTWQPHRLSNVSHSQQQSYSGLLLNLLWNDFWNQTFYCFILYKLPHFCGAHNTEKMDALNKQILTLLLQDYTCSSQEVCGNHFSFHWFCLVIAAQRVVMVTLRVQLCCLSCGSIFFRHNSRHSSIVGGLKNYFVQVLVFYTLSRLSKK